MCGILGLLNYEKPHLENIKQSMSHRGPDDFSYYENRKKNFFMYHSRLSIIDLDKRSHQPMRDHTENYIIVFNGEIYNYREIKKELVLKGHIFKTESDTEVVLTSYIQWGNLCLNKFRGMFSFCIYDIQNNELFLARDRFGIKPLLYFCADRKFLFSSELKPIIALNQVDKRINEESLNDIYEKGSVGNYRTIFKNIRVLKPGHFMKIDMATNITISPYYNKNNISYKIPMDFSYQDSVMMLREKLEESAKYHLISDVNIGAYLSGGIDSAATVALLQNALNKPIKTFTLGFEGISKHLDESRIAEKTAKFLRSDHTCKIINSNDVSEIFDKFIYALDQPSIDGINSFLVSEFASKQVKVAVSGLGGDEIFGGYNHFRKIKDLHARKSNLFDKFFNGLHKIRPNRFTLNSSLKNKSPEICVKIIRRLNNTKNILLSPKISHSVRQHENLTLINRISAYEIDNYLHDTLLRDSDATTMGNSLELRPLLLDHKIVETALSLPDNFKIDNKFSKKIFFDSVKDIIPIQTRDLKKRGFEMPFVIWMNSSLNDRFNSLLNSKLPEGILNREYLKKLRHRAYQKNLIWNDWISLVLLSWLSLHKVRN